jgi:transposase-like protein
MTCGTPEQGETGQEGNIRRARAVPYYCPYCADEDLRPDQADGIALPHGQWRCGGCQRGFALKYLGTAATQRKVTS